MGPIWALSWVTSFGVTFIGRKRSKNNKFCLPWRRHTRERTHCCDSPQRRTATVRFEAKRQSGTRAEKSRHTAVAPSGQSAAPAKDAVCIGQTALCKNRALNGGFANSMPCFSLQQYAWPGTLPPAAATPPSRRSTTACRFPRIAAAAHIAVVQPRQRKFAVVRATPIKKKAVG